MQKRNVNVVGSERFSRGDTSQIVQQKVEQVCGKCCGAMERTLLLTFRRTASLNSTYIVHVGKRSYVSCVLSILFISECSYIFSSEATNDDS